MATAKYSIQLFTMLLLVLPVATKTLAHGGELHGQPKQEKTVNTPASDPTDEPTVTDDDSSPSTEETASVNNELTTSASIVPVSFGDLLFGLMVVFPWLLIAVRNQLNPSRGS
ncbi:MAG: hypothetical protein AAF959_13870 [Cyanobacteria bacterium P01_D01_bin.56]